MQDFIWQHTFYNMMKQNKCFTGDRRLCVDLVITNSKFWSMMTKFLKIGLSDHHHIYYSQNKIWKFWTEEINIP